ncbi:bactofilin family protein [Methyloligella solikamskensis]|uniref:Polymer-forming cytoskeletal protein n=1 Tax=Methyloligella solikamskensis TaxID=1177756 RepID=A0ABW3JCS4_9HYPH
MADNAFRPEDNGAYIGPGVTFKGEISGPEKIVVEGIVEGDITAGSLHIGPNGSVKGNVVATEADVEGTLSSNVDIKDFLLLRSTGRVEGQIRCGDFQVERGAVLAGDFAAGNGESQKTKAETASEAPKQAPKAAESPAKETSEEADTSGSAEPEASSEEVRLEAAE